MDSSGNTIKSGGSLAGKPEITGEVYILNLYLQKGTIPVFLEMSDLFFSTIQQQLTNQDKMDELDFKKA